MKILTWYYSIHGMVLSGLNCRVVAHALFTAMKLPNISAPVVDVPSGHRVLAELNVITG